MTRSGKRKCAESLKQLGLPGLELDPHLRSIAVKLAELGASGVRLNRKRKAGIEVFHDCPLHSGGSHRCKKGAGPYREADPIPTELQDCGKRKYTLA